MVDNVAITAGSGTTIRTDDVGGVQYQVMKLDGGGDGLSVPIIAGQQTMASSIPVVIASNQTGVATTATGAAASGAAVSGNPVLIAGSDTANARSLLVDTSGRLVMANAAAPGAATPGTAALFGGTDGANLRALSVTSAGVLDVRPSQATTVSGSVSSPANLFSQDCNEFTHVAVLVTSAGTTCTIAYEGSPDNTNWTSIAMGRGDGTSVPTTTSTSVGSFVAPVLFRYFRARVSTYTSGTVSVVATFRNLPTAPSWFVNTPTNIVQLGTTSATLGLWLQNTFASNSTTHFRAFSTASSAAVAIKASAGRLIEFSVVNLSASVRYVRLFNTAAASVTAGTTAPIRTYPVAAGTTFVLPVNDIGLYFSNAGWSFNVTATSALDTDASAPAANDVLVQGAYT